MLKVETLATIGQVVFLSIILVAVTSVGTLFYLLFSETNPSINREQQEECLKILPHVQMPIELPDGMWFV